VLDQSYRLPKTVFDLGENIIKNVNNRNQKEFRPTAAAGTVNYVSSIDDVDMDKGEWLILARNSYTLNDAVERLRRDGLPYKTNYYDTNHDDPLKAAQVWEQLRSGAAVTVKEASLVLEYIKDANTKPLSVAKEGATVTMKDLVTAGCLPVGIQDSIWHQALSGIPVEDRDYYVAARRRGESLKGSPRIKVSTIHGAKGGEAENVVVYSDVSLRTYLGMEKSFEDECRVFYVAVTRSKNNLYIVQPRTNNCFLI
jgi:DNA helicase-2/ATP-dependent DNA helicase PcrA